MYDLRSAWIMAGVYIANVSPSVREETFHFPSGHSAKYKLEGNPITISSPKDETCMVFRRGTEEWSELLAIRGSVQEQLDAKERELRRTMEQTIKTQLDDFMVRELARRGVLIEGKEERGKEHLPTTAEEIEAQSLADEKYFEDEDEVAETGTDHGSDTTESVTCPDCDYVGTKRQLQGHSISHKKAAATA